MKTKHLIDEIKSDKKFEETEGVAFEINAEALEHIMSTLTNLYSDVKTAVAREYLSNAIDSHILAGCDQPVLITLPDYNNGLTLTIQDFGVGMSLEQINKIYRKYGASTKNSDNNSIGGFGLGGKSALAISDKFAAVSIQDGQKVTFHVEKRSDNLPYLVIDKVEKTAESNGLKVAIPYGTQIAEQVIPRLLSGFPVNSVKLTNSRVGFRSVWDKKLYRQLKHFNGDILGWYSSNVDATRLGTIPMISVGGVLYPIEFEQIPGELESLKKLVENVNKIKFTKVINLPVGSVKFTPSREDLVYNERTVNTLTRFFEDYVNGLEADLQNRLNAECETREEAIAFVTHWQEGFTNHYWRGEKVEFKITSRQEGMYRVFRNKTLSVDAFKATGLHNDDLFQTKSNVFSNSKRIFLIHDDKDFENYREIKEYYRQLLRLKMKQIEAYFNISEIYIVPRAFAENVWYSHYSNNKKITVSKFLEEVAEKHKLRLKEEREARKNSNVSQITKVKETPKYRYRVLKFDDTHYSAVQVNSDDKVLQNKKVAFIHENNRNFGIALSSTYAQSNARWNAYMRLVQEKYKDYTIFVVTNRQGDSKIYGDYPNIKVIKNEIIDLAVKKFNTAISKREIVSFNEFSNYMSSYDRSAVNILKEKYISFKKVSAVRIPRLDDFLNTVSGDSTFVPITDYDDLVPRSVREEKMLPYIQKVQSAVADYSFFRHMVSFAAWKTHIKAIEKAVENM